jgi:hypothetical protein
VFINIKGVDNGTGSQEEKKYAAIFVKRTAERYLLFWGEH